MKNMRDSLEIIAPKGLVHYMGVIIGSCWDKMPDDESGAVELLVNSCKYCIKTAEQKKWVKTENKINPNDIDIEINTPAELIGFMYGIDVACRGSIMDKKPHAVEMFVTACKKCVNIAEKKKWVKK